MAPFYRWDSTASRLQPLREGSLLFTIQLPEIPGTHFIDLRRMKGWVDLGATQWFWTQDPWIGNPAPQPLAHCSPQLWNWYHQQRKHYSFLLVGGTMKRLVKLESLRMPFENQILTPWDMYEWEDENIENIKFFCFNRGHCFRYLNQNRLTTAETIDGKRSYHCFWPNAETKLELYTLSADKIFVVKNLYASKDLFVDTDCLKIGHYVAAVYEGQ